MQVPGPRAGLGTWLLYKDSDEWALKIVFPIDGESSLRSTGGVRALPCQGHGLPVSDENPC